MYPRQKNSKKPKKKKNEICLPFIPCNYVFFANQIIFGYVSIVDIYFECSNLTIKFVILFTFSCYNRFNLFDTFHSNEMKGKNRLNTRHTIKMEFST